MMFGEDYKFEAPHYEIFSCGNVMYGLFAELLSTILTNELGHTNITPTFICW